ncbi:hypothetical protein D8B23_10935 [Verminephrobacter aporrectodeae subsp. tuberculatae]|uniref:hypothetical protein n=1 Tax=Verminephrobacter aporrectodeae TaxID=1110389 RepID=UPI0022376BC2|nr:hypothetical protein [Verminephrobacter aporrectodeae]MCW5255994.1 hypothetical protein [Verminephrobacter aporrectodeae subsp. tuberculatae]MCW8198929.1 hypothetical protein [Verminephrobacter aporrectodeae subsp. tuberculatae]
MSSKSLASLLLALASCTFIAGPAHARSLVPIVNQSDVAVVTSSGKAPGKEQVKQIIMTGAAARGWTVAEQADGKLLATVMVRGKHSISVLMDYAPGKYSLAYHNSMGMNYDQQGGQPVIHPKYNTWVQNLQEAIRAAALKR